MKAEDSPIPCTDELHRLKEWLSSIKAGAIEGIWDTGRVYSAIFAIEWMDG